MKTPQNIVLYDGICGLCYNSVKWLIRHDREKILNFASLHSEYSRKMMLGLGLEIPSDTIVFFDGNEVYYKSDAVIKILTKLKGIYTATGFFMIIPGKVRNVLYDWVARKRYKWFSPPKSCTLPALEI